MLFCSYISFFISILMLVCLLSKCKVKGFVLLVFTASAIGGLIAVWNLSMWLIPQEMIVNNAYEWKNSKTNSVVRLNIIGLHKQIIIPARLRFLGIEDVTVCFYEVMYIGKDTFWGSYEIDNGNNTAGCKGNTQPLLCTDPTDIVRVFCEDMRKGNHIFDGDKNVFEDLAAIVECAENHEIRWDRTISDKLSNSDWFRFRHIYDVRYSNEYPAYALSEYINKNLGSKKSGWFGVVGFIAFCMLVVYTKGRKGVGEEKGAGVIIDDKLKE